MLGIWLDRKAGTAPWLMLLFLGFGFAAGIRAVWRYVAAADREAQESEEAESMSPTPPSSPTPPTPPAASGSASPSSTSPPASTADDPARGDS
jgi:hypothetical protein